MNIFYLDPDIHLCAQYHCDSHVVKMILESTQILCTTLYLCGVEAPYRPTHQKHPCVLWARNSLENWRWLQLLAIELNREYQYRFEHNTPHRSLPIALALPDPPLPTLGITERPQAMPEQYKVPGDPVTAYRQFYLGEKTHLLKYTKRPAPPWTTPDLAINYLLRK